MTVYELIKKLEKYDPNHVVSLDGFEGGVTDKFIVKESEVFTNVNKAWWYGEHEYTNVIQSNSPIEKRVIITKERNG